MEAILAHISQCGDGGGTDDGELREYLEKVCVPKRGCVKELMLSCLYHS